jgi:hypothetical protein
VFDDRQLATLILIAVALLLVLCSGSGRRTATDLARQALSPAITIPLALYLGWLALVHWFAALVDLWNTRLIGESIFWFGASGLSLAYLAATGAGKQGGFFHGRLREAAAFAVLFECYLNVKTLPLIGELILQTVVTVIVAMRALTQRDPSRARLDRFLSRFLIFTGLALILYTTVAAAAGWAGLDVVQELRKFFMPFWLTLGALPFAYLFALFAAYDKIFRLAKAATGQDGVSWAARLGVVVGLGVKLPDIHAFGPRFSRIATETGTYEGGLAATREAKRYRATKIAEVEASARRLSANAGVPGADDEGRRLDQREFNETKQALRWVATVQMGRYRGNRNRYVSDVLNILGDFDRHGLPGDHGVFVNVRHDGQAWFAYRRTITGWVLASGSREAPPDQWFYDGPEPPSGYPGESPGWGDIAHAETANWG